MTHLTSKFIFWGLFQGSLVLRKHPLDLEESVTSINPLFTMATAESQRHRAHNRGFISRSFSRDKFKTQNDANLLAISRVACNTCRRLTVYHPHMSGHKWIKRWDGYRMGLFSQSGFGFRAGLNVPANCARD